MRIAAGVIGLIIGFLSLLYVGVFGALLGSAVGWMASFGPAGNGSSAWADMVKLLSWLGPVTVIAGGGITFGNPRLGGIVLAGGGFMHWYLLGFSVIGNIFIMPIGLAAVLAFSAGSTRKAAAAPSSGGVFGTDSADSGTGFDSAKWKALAQYDQDIAAAVARVRPLGALYVNELAAAFMALNDKAYLPQIVERIERKAAAETAESAAFDAELRAQREAAQEEWRRNREEVQRKLAQAWLTFLEFAWSSPGRKRITAGVAALVVLAVTAFALWPEERSLPAEAIKVAQTPSVQKESGTSAQNADTGTASSPPAAGSLTLMTAIGTSLVTKDFLRNGQTIEDSANKGRYLLAGDLGYCGTGMGCTAAPSDEYNIFYDSASQTFTVALLSEPIGRARLGAERFLLNVLGVSERQLCTLKHYVGTTYRVNEQFSDHNLGFSFCSDATVLPPSPAERGASDLSGSAQRPVQAHLPDVETVVLFDVEAHSGPGYSYPTALRLQRGENAYVDSAHRNWCMINSAEGMFVPCSALAPPQGGWVVGKTVKQSCWPRCGD